MQHSSTIAAISTGSGSGIGIVRLSGPDAIAIAEKVFFPCSPHKQVSHLPGYSCTLGQIRAASGPLDEALLLLFRAPKSYTGEDLVEFSCHGGRFVLEEVLSLLIRMGAVPAAPGEFTKRAFLSGKMSLTQAESVIDVISAQNAQGLHAALETLDGALFRAVSGVTDRLLDTASHLAAWIDYPEEDVEELLIPQAQESLQAALDRLLGLSADYGRGRMVREGISTAIVGAANVGKSTLMNLLAGCERSIVTDIPGTTRDVIEETVRAGDLLLRLWDTAGLRESADPVEQIGVSRSRERLERSDLVLAVFDGSKPLTDSDRALLESLKGRLSVGILNKSDLGQTVDESELSPYVTAVVTLSARERSGLEQLEDAICRIAGLRELDPSAGLLANARQLACVTAAIDSLREGLDALQKGFTLDAVSVCIEDAAGHLLELTGQNASEEIVNAVFERFCVGK